MIKICYIIQSWYLGGIETAIYNIAERLASKYPGQYEFHFIATDNQQIHPKFASVGQANYMSRDWGRITQYLSGHDIDILQWGNVSEYAKCGSDAGVPVIIERIAGARSLGKNHSYNTHIISSSDGIVPAIKREWSGGITVIKNGINTRALIGQRLGFKDDDFVIVYPAARMGEGQNYQMLISSAIEAHRQNSKIKLVLMGEHPAHAAYPSIKGKLTALAGPLGASCVFTGFLLDPDPIIAGADVCCVPARAHGISNALISAAGYGVPVISTDVGQNDEICVDGVNGYLYNDEENELYKRMLLVSRDANLRNTLAQNARKTALNLYTKEKYVNAVISEIRKMVS